MFGRRKSKYDNFSPEDMPPKPPNPENLDDEILEIKKLESDDDIDDEDDEPIADSDFSTSPPLFIKIDKYNDIIGQIRKLKSLSLGVRDTIDALSEMEKEIAIGVNIANKSLEEFNAIVNELDLRFTRVKEAEKRVPKNVENYIENSFNKVQKLKKKIKKLE